MDSNSGPLWQCFEHLFANQSKGNTCETDPLISIFTGRITVFEQHTQQTVIRLHHIAVGGWADVNEASVLPVGLPKGN